MAQVETVQQIYEAFGRGDVAAILSKMADAVEWEYGGRAEDVPWLHPRQGRAQVAGFFEALGALQIHAFTPKTFFSSGAIVVALVDLDATVKATGKRFHEEDEVHIWHFDSAGRVTRFRHRVDTRKQWEAYGGA